MQDIRWVQRFDNYLKAFQTLVEAVELARGVEVDLQLRGSQARGECAAPSI